MASPDQISNTESTETSWATSHTISLGSYVPGDHILLVFGINGSGGTISDPGGWTGVHAADLNSNQKWRVWIKAMDGTEGSSVTITTGAGNKSAAQAILFRGARAGQVFETAWDIAVATKGYGSSVDPPSVTPAWGSGDNTYVALGFAAGSGHSVSSYMTNYTLGTDTTSAATVMSASRKLTGSAEDPGAFTLSGSDNFQAITVVLREAATIIAGAEIASGTGSASDATALPPNVVASAEAATGTGTAFFAGPPLAQTPADLVVEWDFDGDGDFDETVETITADVIEGQITRGRDYASQVQGRSTPGQMALVVDNTDDKYSFFNSDSELNDGDNSLKVGRLIRVRTSESSPSDPVELARDLFGGNGPLDVADLGSSWVNQTSAGWSEFNGQAEADGPPVSGAAVNQDPEVWSWTLDHHGTVTDALRPVSGETISLRSSSELTITSSGTSHDITLPATIEAGDLILVYCATQSFTDAGTPSTPSGYTLRWSLGHQSANKPRITCFYRVADGTEDSTNVTLDWGSTSVSTHAVALVYDGVHTTSPFDVTQTGPTSGTNHPNPAPISPITDGALAVAVVAGYLAAGTGSPTTSSGWTSAFDQSGDTGAFVIITKEIPDAGAPHIATMTLTQFGYYMQCVIPERDTSNQVGMVYHWTDDENYGVVYLADRYLIIKELVSNAWTTLASVEVENRADVALGLANNGGSSLIAYMDGVEMLTATSTLTATTVVGLWGLWFAQRSPHISEFRVWDRSRVVQSWDSVDQTGVLATMKVQRVVPFVGPDQAKYARITATGRLGQLDRPITSPASVGVDETQSVGIYPGHMIGNILHRVGALQPPSPIARGDVQLGSVGFSRQRAISLARRAEDVEQGLLFETVDGGISFQDRSHRDGSSVVATFTDDPSVQGFAFRRPEQRDWQGDIVNRVRSEVSPIMPRLITSTTGTSTATGVANDVDIEIPGEGAGTNDAAVGDLLIVAIASTVQNDSVFWETPAGWTSLRPTTDALATRVYAKRLAAADFGTTVTFYDDSTPAGGAYTAALFLVKNWFGVLESGVSVTEFDGNGGGSAEAQAGNTDPPVMFTPWPIGPTLFIPIRAGIGSTSGMSVSSPSDDSAPDGFIAMGGDSTEGNTNADDVAIQWAQRIRTEAVSNPGPFGGTFTGFDLVESAVIAVRGFAGSPPPESGGLPVVGNNTESQLEREAVLDHPHPGILFATEEDAETYNDFVLTRFDQDRPIISFEIVPTSDPRYRVQAYTREISDRVRLDMDGPTGFGIDTEYFIETITHTFGEGTAGWRTRFACSPATDPGGGVDPDEPEPSTPGTTVVLYEAWDTVSTDLPTDYAGVQSPYGQTYEFYDDDNGNSGWGVRRTSALSVENIGDEQDGNSLVITAENGTGADAGKLVSGGLKVLLPQTYCQVEFRMRCEGDQDKMTSPVMILWPVADATRFPDSNNASGTNGEWPAGSELDMTEGDPDTRDTRKPAKTYIHRLTPGATTPYDDSPPSDDDQFFGYEWPARDMTMYAKYVFDWRPEQLYMSIDNDFQFGVVTNDKTWIPDWPMELTIQLDPFPAPATPTTQPQFSLETTVKMYVDYILIRTFDDL